MNRKIFFVPASGTAAAAHFRDTIERRRAIDELIPDLRAEDAVSLAGAFKGTPMAIWGARPGPSSKRLWNAMRPGDYVLFYQSGKFTCIGEVAHKTRNAKLATRLWGEAPGGETWELVYFLINDVHLLVSLEKFNELFGFKVNFRPQGFAQIRPDRQEIFERHYGDVYDVMIRLHRGQDIREKREAARGYQLMLPDSFVGNGPVEAPSLPSPHTEIQWRLLRMGALSSNEVWVARNDRSKAYDGNRLDKGALDSLPNLGLDPLTTRTVELIDAIWLRGNRITSAFEVENSTSIDSGILRLSDLKAQAPNLTFPLYIVAPDDRREEVMKKMGRPTFSAISVSSSTRFLPYSKVRNLDEGYAGKGLPVTPELLQSVAEPCLRT